MAGVLGKDMVNGDFDKLKLALKAALITVLMAPLLGLSLYFHIQFDQTLRTSGKLSLAALAASQRNTVDLFFQERLVNIFSLFHSKGFSLTPSQEEMNSFLSSLKQSSDAFIDVGFFTNQGRQIGYAGPYPFLQGRDYSSETWFADLMEQDRQYYISDIYRGFRNKLHFTVAVRQVIDGRLWIMRATLDPDKLYEFLKNISAASGVESALINQHGLYQVVNPTRGELFARSSHMPSQMREAGTEEVIEEGGRVLIAYAWLKETSWVLVVSQPLRAAYATMFSVRRFMIITTVAVAALGLLVIWFSIDMVVGRAKQAAQEREELTVQLFHASKLASIGELAAGVAHEINNPLAIIHSECGVIKDMLDPQFGLDASPDNILLELEHIHEAVFRAKGITQTLLNFSRKSNPRLTPTNVNDVLDEVMGGLKQKELELANIRLVRKYGRDLPALMLDADKLRQVFLNLVNNASDAIGGQGGVITLSTLKKDEKILVSVQDTGKGMTPEVMEKMFMPFFTTKDVGKGTGLGLSVSLNMIESMGGSIDVQSVPGRGSVFTVLLSIYKAGEENVKTGKKERQRTAAHSAGG